MTKLNKEKKGENGAVKRVRKSQEKIEFNGEILSRCQIKKKNSTVLIQVKGCGY